jgi:group I intron endonuclease
MSGVY